MNTAPILFGIIALPGSTILLAASPAETFNANARAMVFITTTNGASVVDTGSGFLVSHDGFVITTAHMRTGVNDVLTAVVGAREGTKYTLTPIEADANSDVALWRLPQSPICRQSVTFGEKPPKILDRLTAVGFPAGSGLSPAAVAVANLNGPHGWLRSDGALEPGNSGGPVFNEAGQVVAIVQGGKVVGAAENDLIPVAPALHLLQKHGVAYSVNTPAPYAEDCYAQCRNPAHGIEQWQAVQPWYRETGWENGGHNRPDECAALKAAALADLHDPGADIQITSMDESSEKDFVGHVTYKYKCTGTLMQHPIYREKRSSACGLFAY